MSELRTVGHVEIGPIQNEQLLNRSVKTVGEGRLVAFHTLGVCGLLGDGSKASTWSDIQGIKGGDKVRAGFLRHEWVPAMGIIDLDRLDVKLWHLLTTNPERLAQIVGGKAHLRYPVKVDAAPGIPPQMLSYDAQHGHQFQVFEVGGTNLGPMVDLLFKNGIQYPVVTSLNVSGTGSLTDPEAGIALAAKSGVISQFLLCGDSGRVGSFGALHGADLSVLRGGPEIPDVLRELGVVDWFPPTSITSFG